MDCPECRKNMNDCECHHVDLPKEVSAFNSDGLSCADCGEPFNAKESIDNRYCDTCRLGMWPCLECGAIDEYQAGEKCICSGDKDNCHAQDHLL